MWIRVGRSAAPPRAAATLSVLTRLSLSCVSCFVLLPLQLNDFANAQSYISRALQLRPKTQLYQRLADELVRKAASPSSASHNEVPESWDD